jgi:hypothetical protein
MTIRIEWHAAARLAGGILLSASLATALAACSDVDSSLPTISAADVASGLPLPQGVLPNGVLFEPYGN